MQRDTTTRRRLRAAHAKGNPSCYLCGHPIDFTLPHLDPMEYVVDHVVPLAHGGKDNLPNTRPTHRECNARKGAKLTQVLRSSTLNR